MTKDYKITSKVIPGAIYLRYEDGALAAVALELTGKLDENVWSHLKQQLQLQENLKRLAEMFQVKPLDTGRSVQDKIIMFCGAYKHYRGVPYYPKELEKANLKNVAVSPQLLDTFFKSPLANYTLDNYIKRINITRDWSRNGMNNHLLTAFPDDYDPTFESTLSGERIAAYWAHLRDKGWRKTDRGWTNE
jgi:hypothetical protein